MASGEEQGVNASVGSLAREPETDPEIGRPDSKHRASLPSSRGVPDRVGIRVRVGMGHGH